MSRQKSVALLIETSNAYARNLLRGVLSYIHVNESWSIYLPEQQRGALPPDWFHQWRGDGVIARIETAEIAQFVEGLGVPVVDVSAARFVPEIPFVETDDQAIAQLAFEHLSERGFEHFAFCGEAGFQWSTNRETAFERIVRASGRQYRVFNGQSSSSRGFSLAKERARLTEWIRSLPRPVALLAAYDIKAQQIMDICRQERIEVPEEIALLGVDNDELVCRLCTPPLSSVIPAAKEAGFEAARLLERMMAGQTVEQLKNLMEPLGVATRQSTDVLAIDDADVAEAMRFIRDSACDGIDVHDVLQKVAVSRRVLEKRFKEIVGHTPHREIIRRRVERIKRYLTETDLTISQIAMRTGFQNDEYMSVTFRRSTGIPPGKYRRQHGQPFAAVAFENNEEASENSPS